MVSHSAANSTHTFAPALYSSCAKMFAIPHGCQFELRGSPRQGRLEQVITSIGTQSVPHLLAPLWPPPRRRTVRGQQRRPILRTKPKSNTVDCHKQDVESICSPTQGVSAAPPCATAAPAAAPHSP